MGYYLETPLQKKYIGIHIGIRTNNNNPYEAGAQTITLPDGTIINILYDGIIPYILVWSPTLEEIDSCLCVAFKSWNS